MFFKLSQSKGRFFYYLLTLLICGTQSVYAQLTDSNYCFVNSSPLWGFCINNVYFGVPSNPAPFSTLVTNEGFADGVLYYIDANNQVRTAPGGVLLKNSLMTPYFLGASSGPLPNILYNDPCGYADPVTSTFGNFTSQTLLPLSGTGPSKELIVCSDVRALGGIRPQEFFLMPLNTTTPYTSQTIQMSAPINLP
ncbi:MAG: hypothetical protein K1X79_10535 [Oligoflexia bacterium]|nr:hypothetical protein [Oligoflexia bacterium]